MKKTQGLQKMVLFIQLFANVKCFDIGFFS